MPGPAGSERRLRRTLAANLRRHRADARLTLEEASHRAGMHWRHWQKLEAGEVNATLRTLARLGDALGTAPFELLR